ncbi:MAG: short-chain dehydrogenase [Anaerolineae bacterium CG_4_9_14_0_8_um_filter_58_9]|nr:MAG: short-chain dehydrogenase [Anaerolineae bacterium CG_4_9_14_0_8_um_filter_58_9]
MTGKLTGRVAIITGATSGIGKATALLFASEGADLVITGRRAELGQRVAEECRLKGVRSAFVQADHTRPEDCERVVAETLRLFGKIDILFNNAGIVLNGTAETTSEEDWNYLMALNVTAVWRMSRLVLPHMRAQGKGVIVNNASDWGVVGAADALAYAASKGAVVLMTKSMALDHAAEGIRVNAVCPGDTLVDRWIEQGYFKDSGAVTYEQAVAEASYLPMKRFGRPEEIARAVLFLACDDSSFVTGATLLVDGGNTAQ